MNVKKFSQMLIDVCKTYIINSIITVKSYRKTNNLLVISEGNNAEAHSNDYFNIIDLDINGIELNSHLFNQNKQPHKIKAVLLMIDINHLINFNSTETSNNLHKLLTQLNKAHHYLRKESNFYIELIGNTRVTGFNEFFKQQALTHRCIELSLRHEKQNQDSSLLYQKYCELTEKISNDCLKLIYQQKSLIENKNLYFFMHMLNESLSNAKKFIESYIKINVKGKFLNLKGIYFSVSQDPHKFNTENIDDQILKTEERLFNKDDRKNLELIFNHLESSNNNKSFKKYINSILLLVLALIFSSIVYICHHEYSFNLNFSKKAFNFVNLLCNPKNKNYKNPIVFIEKNLMSDPSFIKYEPIILLLPQARYINSNIHQLIKPTLSKLLYQKSKPWLESLLRRNTPAVTNPLLISQALSDQLIAVYAYLSLAKPKMYHNLINSWCYFSYGSGPYNLIQSCQNLMNWIEPHFEFIDRKIVDRAIHNFLKASLIQRVFSHYYARSILNQNEHIYFKKYAMLIDSSNSYSFLKIFTINNSPDIHKILLSYEKDTSFIGINDDISSIWNKNYLKIFKQYLNDTGKVYWNERLKQIKIKNFKSSYYIEELINKIQRGKSDFQLLVKLIQKIKIRIDQNILNQIADYDFYPLIQWLSKINYLLEQINQGNTSDNKTNPNINQIIEQSSESPFNEIINIAKNSPFPYSLWITQIYQQIWYLFALHYLDQAGHEWKKQVLPLLNSDILSKYPFSESENEISITEFENIFSPKKTVDQFMEKYFYRFMHLENNKLQPLNINELRLPISKRILDFLNIIYHIKINYFDAVNGNASFLFKIKPIELSHNSRSLKINLSGQSFNYYHGPQFNKLIHWPKENYSYLKLINFNNHSDEFQYKGPWSLFRLLNSSSNITSTNEGIQFHYETPQQYCDFIIDKKIKPEYLNLEILKKLRFPNNFIN